MGTVHPDRKEYFHFTGPARLDKAMNSLHGVLKGIGADSTVTDDEMSLVRCWIREHENLEKRHPFNEIIPTLRAAISDGIFDGEELADILWLTEKLTVEKPYYDAASCAMQSLHGILAGIAADHVISMDELDKLSAWMTEQDFLKGCWPFDEIYSLLVGMRADKFIDAKEHAILIRFFSEFCNVGPVRALTVPLNEGETPITGLCAVCPDIEFVSRLFCFTGSSEKCTRKELAEIVAHLGGEFSDNLRQEVDYLVIGADGNPCWAYSCYGRKVEQAMEWRKKGRKMLLVHEYDFWDAARDLGYEC